MATKKPKSLSDLKAWDRNPRTITQEASSGLETSMQRFGDISGITWNRRNGCLVCGHRRVEKLRQQADGAEIKMLTAERGVIQADGQEWPIRIVDMTDEEHALAAITANNQAITGDWTPDLSDMIGEVATDEDVAGLMLEESVETEEVVGKADQRPHQLGQSEAPPLTWCLIGMPTTQWGRIAEHIEAIAETEGVRMEMTATDEEKG